MRESFKVTLNLRRRSYSQWVTCLSLPSRNDQWSVIKVCYQIYADLRLARASVLVWLPDPDLLYKLLS